MDIKKMLIEMADEVFIVNHIAFHPTEDGEYFVGGTTINGLLIKWFEDGKWQTDFPELLQYWFQRVPKKDFLAELELPHEKEAEELKENNRKLHDKLQDWIGLEYKATMANEKLRGLLKDMSEFIQQVYNDDRLDRGQDKNALQLLEQFQTTNNIK